MVIDNCFALVGFRYPFCALQSRLSVLSSFAVFFHTDQSNNDWGFKMSSLACVAAPEEADEEKSEVRNIPAILRIFCTYV